MAWTSPITFTPNSILTAAQMNTYLRDNMLETAPGKVTGAGQYLVGTGALSVAARSVVSALTAGPNTSSSTTYTTPVGGPAVTVTTGTFALVIITATISNDTANKAVACSYAVSGASSIPANDEWKMEFQDAGANNSIRASMWDPMQTLTAGSNTFTFQVKVESGGGTGAFEQRQIIVMPLT